MRVAVFRVDMTRRGDGRSRHEPRKDCPERGKARPGPETATVERRAARVSSLRRKPLRRTSGLPDLRNNEASGLPVMAGPTGGSHPSGANAGAPPIPSSGFGEEENERSEGEAEGERRLEM